MTSMFGSSPRPVPRALRAVNVLALLLFLAGAGLHVRSWLGMRGLREYQARPDGPLFAGMAEFEHFWQLARIGTWLVWAAVALAILAAIAAVLADRRRRQAPPGD